MSGENGTNGNGRQEKGTIGRDPVTGQFLKGNPGGPGRPVRVLGPTWRKMVREVAKARNVSSKELMIDVALELFRQALDEGDLKAVLTILDREIGPIDRGALVAIDARHQEAHVNAELPSGSDRAEYMKRFIEIVTGHQLIGEDGK